MTPKEKPTKEDKKLQTLDEICENTRAIRYLSVVLALNETDAFTSQQVDCRYEIHSKTSKNPC